MIPRFEQSWFVFVGHGWKIMEAHHVTNVCTIPSTTKEDAYVSG